MIKDGDLVAATHGRSFWILDDVTQLHQMDGNLQDQPFRLLKPRTTYRLPSPFRGRKPSPGKNYQLALGAAVAFTETKGPHGETVRKFLDAGQNPPDGVVVTYYLNAKPKEEVVLSFLDADGQLITSFSSKEPESDSKGPAEPRVPAEPGMNRFVWNMRYPDARKVPEDKQMEDREFKPLAPPGTYQVRLTIGDESDGRFQTESFEIVKDPRVAATQADFKAQFDMLIKIRDKLSETHDSIVRLRSVRDQVDEWARRAEGSSAAEAISKAADALKEKLTAIEGELIQTEYKGARDRLNLPAKLNAKLAEMTAVAAAADFAPPNQAHEVLEELSGRLDERLNRLQSVIDEDVANFDNLVHELEVPAIVPRSRP